LMKSHAGGLGEEAPADIVKIMLSLEIQSCRYGNSAVRLETVRRRLDFYNNDVFAVVYNQGNCGAPGDFAPLAHPPSAVTERGEVNYDGYRQAAHRVVEALGWSPITLQSKEGLALLNGTQFMSAYGCYVLIKSLKASVLSDIISTVSLEGFDGRIEPFNHLIHDVRPHKGQVETAQYISELLEGSELIIQHKEHVQDPYSFRCIPQVHGASKDAIAYAVKVFETEINAVTDNPNIFAEEDLIIS